MASETQPARSINLPAELLLEVFGHLNWRSHIPCMQVSKTWRELLMSENLRYKRYTPKGFHRLLDSDVWNRVLPRTFFFDIFEDKILSSELQSYKLEVSNPSFPCEEDAILPIPFHRILEENIFYEGKNIGASQQEASINNQESDISPSARALDGVCMGVSYRYYPYSHPPDGRCFLFKEHPEIRDMSLADFFNFMAKNIFRLEQLEDYERARIKVTPHPHPADPETEYFLGFEVWVETVEWKNGEISKRMPRPPRNPEVPSRRTKQRRRVVP
ncbi:hypothetical protein TWF730_006716 [Orbilia blumenaviensis]|uniref:F-box domain-containing protein n=1 Tax=Orbilia blumenaviensis TaxID=1796055 RepID=A0AAV9VIJ0_9PEZI